MTIKASTVTDGRTLVRVGICAMSYKTHSPSMRAILKSLKSPSICPPNVIIEYIYYHPYFDLPIEEWPSSDLLIAFHSTDYPLEKVKAFIEKLFYSKDLNSGNGIQRRFVINDVRMQEVLMHRQLVQEVLKSVRVRASETITILPDTRKDERTLKFDKELGKHLAMHFDIPLVKEGDGYAYTLPNAYLRSEVFQEGDVIGRLGDGKVLLRKPWVEKPLSSESHDIWAYYPQDGLHLPGLMDDGMRGGRKLFRKQGDKSSSYDPDLFDIRTDDNPYSYESLQQVVDWKDIKVYAVGPSYAHAESRKSPLVDGRVTRDEKGKELRQVLQLAEEQKRIAERISLAFGQFVCGFDLLVTSMEDVLVNTIVDVNGWTYVKENKCFFEDCARRLASLTELVIAPNCSKKASTTNMVVMRHADRSPKQKLKISADMERVQGIFGGRQVIREAEDMKTLLQLLTAEERQRLGDRIVLPSAKILIKRTHLVLKWGGELTHLGRAQSMTVGRELSKHKDLKHAPYYSEHESRVLGTADLVLRSMLGVTALPEGILNVLSEDSSNDKDAKTQLNPPIPSTLQDKLSQIHQALLHSQDTSTHEQPFTACRESKKQIMDRWQALCKEVRISDLYDALKYDLMHHQGCLQQIIPSYTFWFQLYEVVRESYVQQIGPFELGGEPDVMARTILSPRILPLILRCLGEGESLLVFTKEAQMQSVMQLVTGGYKQCKWSEMNYASSIRIEIDRDECGEDGMSAKVRLWKSGGASMLVDGEGETCDKDIARLEKESLLETLTLGQLLQRLQ